MLPRHYNDGLMRPNRHNQRNWEDHRSANATRSNRLGMAALATFSLVLVLLVSTYGRYLQASRPSGLQVMHQPEDIDYFVRVEGGKFVVGPECKPFYISGWNQWEAFEAAGGALELFGASLPENTTGPALVRSLLDRAQLHGLNVLRTWAHPVSAPYALELAPGEYSEAVFRGLDYLLDEARKRGIRVLFALTDNWQPTGGADQFVSWVGKTVHEEFFSDPNAKELYKKHVKILLERTNTINGREYRNDPTIFAFNLINEPRCYQCGNTLKHWIEEMASWVKSIDSNHLLTVGEEGFYPQDASLAQKEANPKGLKTWAYEEGQYFPEDHSSSFIDFASIHLWIHNWEDPTEDFARRWLKQHIEDAKALGKPLLVEEFGAWGAGHFKQERTKWYQFVYDILYEDAKSGGPTMGALFWQWYAAGQSAPAEEGGGDNGLFGVFDYDETFRAVATFTKQMQQLAERNLGNFTCSSAFKGLNGGGENSSGSPVNVKAVAQPKGCSSTWINGQEGTGYEGPACNIDINECARGTADCSVNAACINTIGSYRCECFLGFEGNGKTCTAAPYLSTILKDYVTLGPGKVACKEGSDVKYPLTAPGYVDDILEALPRHKDSPWIEGIGSRVPVSPEQCMLACSTAIDCDSFSYNLEQRRCFLKSKPSAEVCPKAETLCVSARGSPYSCGYWQTYYNLTELEKRGLKLGGNGFMVQAAEGPPGQQGPMMQPQGSLLAKLNNGTGQTAKVTLVKIGS